MKINSVIISLLVFLLCGLTEYSYATSPQLTKIESRIITSNEILSLAKSPYALIGNLQIAKGAQLTIEPGVEIVVQGGRFYNVGNVVIGSNALSRTFISIEKFFDPYNSCVIQGGNAHVENTVVQGINSYTGLFACGVVLTIDNSYIENLFSLGSPGDCGNQVCMTVQNSVISKMASVSDTNCCVAKTFTNNVFYEVNNFSPYANLGSSNKLQVNSNYFFNESVSLTLSIPGNLLVNNPSVRDSSFSNNWFASPNKLGIVVRPGNAKSNFWSVQSEAELRRIAKIVDGETDVRLSKIDFSEMLSVPPFISNKLSDFLKNKEMPAFPIGGYVATKVAADLKEKQEIEAKAKAAAEVKAKQDAEAKLAADLKTKQEAEVKAAAEKTALSKAQSELLAANAALTDSQKVNRELQTKLNSVETQFKLLSDSVSVIQGQVSQLNSKLAVALAGQSAANAKLKKVCSAKPKPKGC